MVSGTAINTDYTTLAGEATLENTVEQLRLRGINAQIVENGDEARKRALSLIPDDAEVLTTPSRTLDEIGFAAEIDSSDRVRSVHKMLLSMDRTTQYPEMRALGARPDVLVCSVHAITEAGEVVIASATGSQLAAAVFGAGNVIWVVGTQKIVPDLEAAMRRLHEYVLPLEDERARGIYGRPAFIGKTLIVSKEAQEGRIEVIFVRENLGF
jgi:hypothetical protein